MKRLPLVVLAVCLTANLPFAAAQPKRQRGSAEANVTRPKSFPHRIWAACDFEAQTPDYAWFGPAQTGDVPKYAANKTALGVAARPYKKFAGLMTGINPVPGPRMGKVNSLYLRYKLSGATVATFQHYSLSVNDNNHIRLSGLTEGKWSEITMNFSRDARRNDGTPGVPFKAGERMDDLKIFVGKPNDGKKYDLIIDDVSFFANDPKLPPEPEPFPNRVIFLAAFDTGTNPKARKKYWPGAFDIITKEAPEDSYWGVARAVARKDRKVKWIRLQISPTRQVGAHTKLRFRYHLTGASRMTVQIFDLTDKDNRHIVLRGCKQNQWTTRYLDFTKDAKRNDGGKTSFAAGHVVDDIFFYVKPDGDLDMFSCEMAIGGKGRWFIWENPGAKRAGTKWTQHIILSGVYGHESRVGDVDGDGDIDICSKPWNGDRHVYLENLLIRKAR